VLVFSLSSVATFLAFLWSIRFRILPPG
jgi:hypothetical protein